MKSSVQKETPLPRSVPFFDGSPSFSKQWPEIVQHLDKVMRLGKFSHGEVVGDLENAIRAYTGARYAIGVNSATDALILGLRAMGIGPGDEVIVPAYTFIASASSIVLAGAIPVFVDVDAHSLSLDPEGVRQAITPRTKAIMPVHLFNQMADMSALLGLAREKRLLVIEDSAEAIGMRYEGVHAGLLGSCGVLSFFPTKTLAALGDAGMILTNDPAIAETVQSTRHHGRGGVTLGHLPGISHEALYCGTNSKMDEIQAAVVLTRLGHLDRIIETRARLANLYDRRLRDIAQIKIPRPVRSLSVTNPVYYVYSIQAKDRNALAHFLSERGIATEVYYPIPLPFQPCFENLGYQPGEFPVSEKMSTTALALPLYPDLSEEAVEYVCSQIEIFYQVHS